MLEGFEVYLAQVVQDPWFADDVAPGGDRLIQQLPDLPHHLGYVSLGRQRADLFCKYHEDLSLRTEFPSPRVRQDGLEETVHVGGQGQVLGLEIVVDDDLLDGVIHQGDAPVALAAQYRLDVHTALGAKYLRFSNSLAQPLDQGVLVLDRLLSRLNLSVRAGAVDGQRPL